MQANCPDPLPALRRDRALSDPTDVAALSVVYVGQAAALLATRVGTLVPVTAGPACLAPGGLGVRDEGALAPVLARWSELDSAAVDLRAWHLAATAVELRIPARADIPRGQLAVLDRGLRNTPTSHPLCALRTPRAGCEVTEGVRSRVGARERAADLARLAVEAHVGELAACVAATVGAGMGTTPAGDDVICGVLAGLDLLGLQHAHQRLGAAVAPLLWTTTRTSRHLLAAAAAGRYTERLVGLAAALTSPSTQHLHDALAALAGWGASSGLDQATGFAAAIRAGSLVGAGAR